MSKACIILNGVAQSGKDEFVLGAQQLYKISNVSSVDVIKFIAQQLGWDGKKDEKSRKFLSDLKDLSSEYNDFPFTDVASKIMNDKSDVTIVHIREVAEIAKLKEWCLSHDIECQSVQIQRQSVLDANIPQNTGDIGATQPYEYDHVVFNNASIEALHEKSHHVMHAVLSLQKS